MCSGRPLLRLPILAMVLLIAFPSRFALAKRSDESDAARAERTKGTVALNLGLYEEAVEHFSEAYVLSQDPILLFNLGQAYRLAGKPDKAVSSYSSFLRAAGPVKKYRPQFDRAAEEIETITPTLMCPPKDRAGTGKPPEEPKQADDATNAPASAAKSTPTPVEPPPVEKVEKAEMSVEPPPVVVEAPKPALKPAAPAPQAPALKLAAEPVAEPVSAPVYKKTWFWSSVVVALAAGGAATWYFTRNQNQAPPSTYGSARVLP